MNLGAEEEGCVEMFKVIHQSVEQKVIDFKEEFRRIAYVTPTSFLELLSMYKKVLTEKRKENDFARNRLTKGLEVLKHAAIEVDNMNRQLQENQPILERTLVEVDETKKVVAEQTVEAEEVKAVVTVEEAEASKQEAEVKAIKDEADSCLAVALPALDRAIAAVKKIEVSSFYEMKAVLRPGPSIILCFKLVCQFLFPGIKPKPPNKPEDKEIDPEGWFFEHAKKTPNTMLSNPNKFLKDLIDFDKDHIPDSVIAKVTPFLEEPALDEKAIAKVSAALVPIRIWIFAMIKYHETLKIVNPMRETAKVMGEKLAKVQAVLAEKQAKVKKILEELGILNAKQAEMIAKAQKLNDDIEDCGKKLIRAEKMISGLEGEKVRWTETVEKLTIQSGFLIGDCLIAAGMVSYAGPFISQYRESLEELWRNKCEDF